MLWITCSEPPADHRNARTAGRYKLGGQWIYTHAQFYFYCDKWALWADGIQTYDDLEDPQWLMQHECPNVTDQRPEGAA